MRVVIIGGVAAGPKTAARIMRLNPDADVTIVEKGRFLSYAGCGLPYYVGGEVSEQKELLATPAGVVRDAAFFLNVKGVKVVGGEALEIDRAGKRVRVRATDSGEESWLDYDKLVLATGASPVVPPLPGVGLKGVSTLHAVPDAEAIRDVLMARPGAHAVIIGGGLIGVETAEALSNQGCAVTLVEMLPQILNMLDWELAHFVAQHMASFGVKVLTDTRALAIGGESGERVEWVETSRGRIAADLVVLAIGVRPNTGLASASGLAIGEKTRAIQVDERMATSDPDIYAVGDCVECRDRVTGQAVYVPLGSTANKQGRVAADNICGVDARFPGVVGSTVCKVFDFTVARTGLTERGAAQAGLAIVTGVAPGPDRAHYLPTAKSLLMKLVAEAGTGRLLGVQAVGPGDGAKRIDVAATAIAAGMTVDDVANLDLSYAPPFAPAMDNLITAANVARNKLSGLMRGISAEAVHAKLERGEDFVLLDVRSPAEFGEVRLPNSINVPLGALRKRIAELPKDKEIVAFCKVSLRGYEAAMILRAAGFGDVKVLDGGVAMWPYAKEM